MRRVMRLRARSATPSAFMLNINQPSLEQVCSTTVSVSHALKRMQVRLRLRNISAKERGLEQYPALLCLRNPIERKNHASHNVGFTTRHYLSHLHGKAS